MFDVPRNTRNQLQSRFRAKIPNKSKKKTTYGMSNVKLDKHTSKLRLFVRIRQVERCSKYQQFIQEIARAQKCIYFQGTPRTSLIASFFRTNCKEKKTRNMMFPYILLYIPFVFILYSLMLPLKGLYSPFKGRDVTDRQHRQIDQALQRALKGP